MISSRVVLVCLVLTVLSAAADGGVHLSLDPDFVELHAFGLPAEKLLPALIAVKAAVVLAAAALLRPLRRDRTAARAATIAGLVVAAFAGALSAVAGGLLLFASALLTTGCETGSRGAQGDCSTPLDGVPTTTGLLCVVLGMALLAVAPVGALTVWLARLLNPYRDPQDE